MNYTVSCAFLCKERLNVSAGHGKEHSVFHSGDKSFNSMELKAYQNLEESLLLLYE